MFDAYGLACKLIAATLIWIGLGLFGMPEAAELSAFPGAQGHGKLSVGGRGGRIIFVTNLDDAGPGSLRACMEAEGPRNCIFRVGGVLELQKPISVRANNGFLSVLGQTAPGGGILITINRTNKEKKHTPLVVKETTDVVLRHIRVRPRFPNTVKNVDAITVESSVRVYLDHVSGSWATDENFNSHADATDITVANSIFGEGLDKHSKCVLLGSDPHQPQKITFWQNACISNVDRNPDDNHFGGSCIDIINNVFFNAKSEWGEVFSQFQGGTPISYVGNYFKAGPSTDKETFAINWNATATVDKPQIFQRDNETWAPKGKSLVLIAPDTNQYLVAQPPCPLSVDRVGSARQAYESVLAQAGAFPRDSVDRRLVQGVGSLDEPGHGKIVNSPGDVPAIDGGSAFKDADADGMPDVLEKRFGANPQVADAWADSNGDGWPNFDQVMEALSQERIAGDLLR